MKLKLLIPFLAALACYGQAVRVDPIPAFTVASNVPAGANPPILALPGATVAVCADAACSTPLNTYTNAGAGTGCPSATPLVPAGTASCAGTTDSRGNFGFWVTAGTNGWYRITTSGATYGPYPFSAPGGGGGGGGGSAWSAITGGTNTTASMVMGTGSSLSRSGGTIDASSWVGVAISPPTTTNQVVLTTSTTTGVWSTIPNCPDIGAHLNYNNSTQAFSCGTSGGTVGSVSFSAITGSTNTSAAMLVGSGASMAPTGTGTITANAIASGSSFSGTLSGPNILLSGTFTVPNSYGTVQCAELNAAGQLVPAGSGACGSGGGGTSPGGSSGQIQYNNGGAFGGFTAAGDLTFSQPNFTLATVNSNVGSCGDATHVSQVTLDAKGRTTGCTAVSITSSTPADMMTTDTPQAVTVTKDFQVDQRFDALQKFYYSSSAPSFSWMQGISGTYSFGWWDSSSVLRMYLNNSGTSPLGGSGITLAAPSVWALATSTNTPSMFVQGASGSSTYTLGVQQGSGSTSDLASFFNSSGGKIAYVGYQGNIQGLTISTTSAVYLNQIVGPILFSGAWAATSASTPLQLGNEILTYNNVATAGMGVPPIYATISLTGQTVNTSGYLQCGGATCPAGMYRISYYAHATANGGSSTQIILPYSWKSGTGTVMSQSPTWSPYYGDTFGASTIYTDGTQAITFASTISAGTATYNLFVSLERLQ